MVPDKSLLLMKVEIASGYLIVCYDLVVCIVFLSFVWSNEAQSGNDGL